MKSFRIPRRSHKCIGIYGVPFESIPTDLFCNAFMNHPIDTLLLLVYVT